ncbi:protein kinase [Amycolatopsis lurida]
MPAHFSPEQAEGRTATSASDVFALGTLLVLAATGTNPFAAGSPAQALYRVVHHRPHLRVLPPGLRRVAENCLDKDPARRPAAAEILRDLPPIHPSTCPWPEPVHDAIAEQRMRIEASTSRGPEPRRRGRRIGLVLAVAAALIAGGTVGVVATESPARCEVKVPLPDSPGWAISAEAVAGSPDASCTAAETAYHETWRTADRACALSMPYGELSPGVSENAFIFVQTAGDATSECGKAIEAARAVLARR